MFPIRSNKIGTFPEDLLGSDKDLGIVECFADNAVQIMYYPKFVKRFILRPYLGFYFPYIDVSTEIQEPQLSFFYGSVNFKFSHKHYCVKCGSEIQNDINHLAKIPVALCPNCNQRIHFSYYECLHKIINCLNKIRSKKIPLIKNSCENFLNSRCGFPSNSEHLNPCLKNHAIGIILKDLGKLAVVIAPRATIKYKLLSEGGLFGIVLGSEAKILNLETIERLMYHLGYSIQKFIKKNNEISETPINFLYSSSVDYVASSFLLFFFQYYQSIKVKSLIQRVLKQGILILENLIRSIYSDTSNELDILAFFELFKTYPPIRHSLRIYMENKLMEITKMDISGALETKILPKMVKGELEVDFFQKYFKLNLMSKINSLTKNLVIYEVLGLFGRYALIKSNVSKSPVIISLNDLIGRKIIEI